MKRITLLLILAYLSPYGVAQEVPLYETITDNVPKIDVTTEVYLGDRMLEQRTGDYRECIIPKHRFELNWAGGQVYTIKANNPLCKKDADAELYSPNYFIYNNCVNGEVTGKFCEIYVRFFSELCFKLFHVG